MPRIEYVANGLGSQSMYLVYLAGRHLIPARYSITADTGAEEDCLVSTGERMTASEFFRRYAAPFTESLGISPRFVRVKDKRKAPYPSLWEHTEAMIRAGKFSHVKIPLYGSRGGTLNRACTSRWKIQAINQELRRIGGRRAKARAAIGIHYGEAARRVKGINARLDGGFWTYTTTAGRDPTTGKDRIVKWLSHYYPLVDLRLRRQDVRDECQRYGIPFIEGSQCDACVYNDLARWKRHTEETIQEIAEVEALMNGEFFFTSLRVPLRAAIARMEEQASRQPSLFSHDVVDFGCGNDLCGL